MKEFHGTIKESIDDIIALLRPYELSWEWVKKNHPDKGVQFHDWLREEIRGKCLKILEPEVRAELKRIYDLSLQDDIEQGD